MVLVLALYGWCDSNNYDVALQRKDKTTMKKSVKDYTISELEASLVRAKTRLNMLRYWANQQFYFYNSDCSIPKTDSEQTGWDVWAKVVGKLNE